MAYSGTVVIVSRSHPPRPTRTLREKSTSPDKTLDTLQAVVERPGGRASDHYNHDSYYSAGGSKGPARPLSGARGASAFLPRNYSADGSKGPAKPLDGVRGVPAFLPHPAAAGGARERDLNRYNYSRSLHILLTKNTIDKYQSFPCFK